MLSHTVPGRLPSIEQCNNPLHHHHPPRFFLPPASPHSHYCVTHTQTLSTATTSTGIDSVSASSPPPFLCAPRRSVAWDYHIKQLHMESQTRRRKEEDVVYEPLTSVVKASIQADNFLSANTHNLVVHYCDSSAPLF